MALKWISSISNIFTIMEDFWKISGTKFLKFRGFCQSQTILKSKKPKNRKLVKKFKKGTKAYSNFPQNDMWTKSWHWGISKKVTHLEKNLKIHNKIRTHNKLYRRTIYFSLVFILKEKFVQNGNNLLNIKSCLEIV